MKIIQLLLEYNREKTIATYGKKIEIANQNDKQHLSSEQIISKIEEVDPSINKQYVQWICKQYISGALKIEDLYKVTEPLILFQKYKKRLPLEQRNIDKLTIFDLYKIEDQINKPQFDDTQQDEKFGSDVKVWYNGPVGYLITPLTKEAAIEYSKGTKWCTGAEKNNRFNYYNKQGNLYIWKDKNGDKYQFHPSTSQYMNAQDNEISKEMLNKFKTHPILKEIFNTNGKIYLVVQQQFQSRLYNILKPLDEEASMVISNKPNYILNYMFCMPRLSDSEIRFIFNCIERNIHCPSELTLANKIFLDIKDKYDKLMIIINKYNSSDFEYIDSVMGKKLSDLRYFDPTTKMFKNNDLTKIFNEMPLLHELTEFGQTLYPNFWIDMNFLVERHTNLTISLFLMYLHNQL